MKSTYSNLTQAYMNNTKIKYDVMENYENLTENDISKLTDLWIKEVTINHDSEAVYKLFCSDGKLVGTVSQVIRKGNDIKSYFDYFAKLPDIKVISKKYTISKISNNVFLNTAFIDWQWKGLEKPITTRMTFIYNGKCIFKLHSSILPGLNKSLLKISNLSWNILVKLFIIISYWSMKKYFLLLFII